MSDKTKEGLQSAIHAAHIARKKGNHPFGAALARSDGEILLTAENTVNTDRDPTAHAEFNLIRKAAGQYPPDYLAKCTLYASTEPCPMCAGAIYWSNIGQVVYGLSQEVLYELAGFDAADSMLLSCREVLSHGKKSVEVIGPIMEEEAKAVHRGFWNE